MGRYRPAQIVFLSAGLVLGCAIGASARAGAPTADQIVQRLLESDPWGLGDAEVSAHAITRESNGSTRELAFTARSHRYAPPLTESLVRFSAPADMAGVGFLQIQKKSSDDDRFLFLPELGRSRRIAGNTRKSAFMGTDFSYADLDRRDLRDSSARLVGVETLGRFACWHLSLTPRARDAAYARVEVWVREDNFVPLKTMMYNRAGVLLKTLYAKEMRREKGHWYITRSLMVNNQENRSTELVIDKLTPRTDIPNDVFTVRTLEKT